MRIRITTWPLLLLGVASGCGQRQPAEREFARRVTEARAVKDRFMSTPDGPLTPAQRPMFHGLRYWDADSRYVCTARLERMAHADTTQFPTSQHTFDPYLRLGRLHFQLGGRDLELTLYQSLEGEHLFVPFTDRTSGRESYGAGRYIDPEMMPDGGVTLDFNRAYNPYCAYNAEWICPLAPSENHLEVRIEAGERVFEAGH